jgi:putative Holliday junction resolvase
VRALGIDPGTRRVGIAVSDDSGILASPLEVLQRSGRRSTDHRRIAELVEEYGVGVVVVGMPLSLDGRVGPAAQAVLDEVGELCSVLDVPVEVYDERFTTITAERQLRAAGRRGRSQRSVVDMQAAAVLLQAWLEGPGRSAGPDHALAGP